MNNNESTVKLHHYSICDAWKQTSENINWNHRHFSGHTMLHHKPQTHIYISCLWQWWIWWILSSRPSPYAQTKKIFYHAEYVIAFERTYIQKSLQGFYKETIFKLPNKALDFYSNICKYFFSFCRQNYPTKIFLACLPETNIWLTKKFNETQIKKYFYYLFRCMFVGNKKKQLSTKTKFSRKRHKNWSHIIYFLIIWISCCGWLFKNTAVSNT